MAVNRSIYLDYAAATPMDPKVQSVMQPFFTDNFYNPSASYLAANAVADTLQIARSSVAGIIGARSPEIIFTAGGSEANNLAIKGVAQAFPGRHMVTTALEHDSVRSPMEFLSKKGWSHTEVLPNTEGLVDPNAVIQAVQDSTVLVSVMYANNEIGTIQPIKQIGQQLKTIRETRKKKGNKMPLYYHTDACQAVNYLDLHVHSLGVDLMTLNGGKIYGPKQSGVLFVASNVTLLPLIHGGGQERGLRSGTENIVGAVGFTRALELAQSLRREESERIKDLQQYFVAQLLEHLPTAHLNGSQKHRLPNNVHITVPNTDNERLLFALDEQGIQAASGSACSASKEESSHVLRALGMSEEQARSSLRFSLGRRTSEADIHRVVQVLTKIVT